jgi:copper(I)-binding protein
MPGTPTSARTLKSALLRSVAVHSRHCVSGGVRTFRPARTAVASLLAVLCACLAVGCAFPAQAKPLIQLSSAQVSEPGANHITDVYVDVQNNGPRTKLISARLSVGGRVTLRSPVHSGQVEMRSVPSITIPANTWVGLDPNGSHLLVTDAGPMRAGTEITLTLVFAHAGAFSVTAMVTNPESGGASYFLN